MKLDSEISRREFVHRSCVLMAGALVAPVVSQASVAKYKIGLQLFTIRDAMANDVKGTLNKVARMGYQDLETYGFDPDQMKYYGLNASSFKQLLDDMQLTTSSGHYDLFKFLDTPADALRKYV